MRAVHNTLLRLGAGVLLAGAGAIGTIGCGGGGAATHESAALVPTPSPAPQSQSPTNATIGAADSSDSLTVPVINQYGELNGIERGPGAPVGGEAALQQHTFVDEGYDSAVTVDPAGKWLTYVSTRHSEHPHVYLQRVDGTAVTQLTNDPTADDAYPTFSPDGKRIAFSSTRNGNWDLYVMDIDGRNMTQVTSGPAQDLHPSFSPDGSRLVYCSLGPRSSQWELWVVNLTTAQRATIGYGLFPSWSPAKDVDRIAFQRARARGSRWFSLWTLDLVDGEARRVTEVAASSNAAIVSPAWSPDGQHLVFQTIVGPTPASKSTSSNSIGQQDIWVMSTDGTGRRRLTDGNGSNLTPCWAVDNRVYFVSDRGGNECVWSVQAGGNPMVLPVASSAEPKPTAAALGAPGVPSNAVGATDAHELDH